MKKLSLTQIYLGIATALSLFSHQSFADIAITAEQQNGDVIFSYSGSIRTAELSNGASELRSGSIAPKNALIQFATTSGSEVLSGYGSSVASAPSDFGTGATTFASSRSGDVFSVTSATVAFPGGYQSGDPLSGDLTINGQTFASLGISTSGGPYVWTLTNAETVTLTVEFTPVVDPNRARILRKIKVLKRKLKMAQKRKQKAKVRRFKKQIRALKRRL